MLSDYETGLYACYAPCFTGAHSQGKILDELNKNLQKVIVLLLEEGNVTVLL
ncbi:MAG: hypothetical protein OXI88_21855 [Gammaproteobacteria bacterium]|nr:hypothetical protein [Gammaproteobacteria bacterium]